MKINKRILTATFALALLLACEGGTCTASGFEPYEEVEVPNPETGQKSVVKADGNGNISYNCDDVPIMQQNTK